MEELSKSNSNKYVLPFTLDFGDDILKLFTVRIGSKLIGNCFGSWFCDAIIKIFRVNMFFFRKFLLFHRMCSSYIHSWSKKISW